MTLLLVLACIVAITFATPFTQFDPSFYVDASPNDYLITSLPGLTTPFPKWKQYAGYITVNQQHGRALFFWFVESQSNPSSDPLTVWFNGGPGCSSLGGFTTEHGPFRPNTNPVGEVDSFYWSWNRVSNVLYLESPAGVGFSYSNTSSDYNTNDNITAADNYIFLQNWYQVFTQFQSNDLWITGESYGGVYVPMVTYNIITGPSQQIRNNLKGIMLGNPVIDCPQYGIIVHPDPLQVDLYYWHAMIPYHIYKTWKDNSCALYKPPNPSFCNNLFSQISNLIGDINGDDLYSNQCTGNGTLDILDTTPSCLTPSDLAQTWLNRLDLKKAIHANLSISWVDCTNNINYTSSNPDILSYILYFINNFSHMKILFYSGDVDIATVPFAYTQECLYQMNQTVSSLWTPWYLPGVQDLAGYVEVWNSYTYATIKGAGHEAPMYQPAEAYFMYSNFLKRGKIPTDARYKKR